MTAETLATVLLWALLLMGGIYVIRDAVSGEAVGASDRPAGSDDE